MVGTWIINSVSPRLQGSIIYKDTALEIWTNLRDTFSQGNSTKVFNLQKQIAEIHQGERHSLIASLGLRFCGINFRILSYFLSVPMVMCMQYQSEVKKSSSKRINNEVSYGSQ